MTPEQILREADRCVKCGLCLPLCPTYDKRRDEGDSPRGRIALIQGLVQGQLEYIPALEEHFARCLKCRACEVGCPSGVAYGRLIDAATELQRAGENRWKRLLRRATLDRLVEQGPLRRAARLLRFYQRSGVQRAARAIGILRLLGLSPYDRLLPPLAAPFDGPGPHRSHGATAGRVALFTGCVSQVLEAPVLSSAIAVLCRLGVEVVVPAGQSCCGALHQHAGETQAARSLARQNLAAFAASEADCILAVDSGCAAQLMENPSLLGDQGNAPGFSPPIQDISHYLVGLAWPPELELIPLRARVAVHEPCSLRNVLKQARAAYALLQRVRELEVLELPGNPSCCGGAGTYLLTQPRMSQALLDDKIQALRAVAPDILVTSNIGCALQLAAGIRASGLDIEVLHPVQLIARQMPGDVPRS